MDDYLQSPENRYYAYLRELEISLFKIYFHSMNPEEGKVRVKRVGNYIIGKTIGEGNFSKVKLGTHLLTNERVAMKIIEKSKITEAADVKRITREIQILKLLKHPNVVRLYEIIDTPRHLYII